MICGKNGVSMVKSTSKTWCFLQKSRKSRFFDTIFLITTMFEQYWRLGLYKWCITVIGINIRKLQLYISIPILTWFHSPTFRKVWMCTHANASTTFANVGKHRQTLTNVAKRCFARKIFFADWTRSKVHFSSILPNEKSPKVAKSAFPSPPRGFPSTNGHKQTTTVGGKVAFSNAFFRHLEDLQPWFTS